MCGMGKNKSSPASTIPDRNTIHTAMYSYRFAHASSSCVSLTLSCVFLSSDESSKVCWEKKVTRYVDDVGLGCG